MKRTELKRKTPLRKRTPLEGKAAIRKGSKRKKSVSEWKALRKTADDLAKVRYRNIPCVICRYLNVFNPNTCWHHYAGRYPSHLRHDPANLMPLCFHHHKGGNDICAHSDNGFASRAFTDIIEKTMPKRIAKLNKSRRKTLKDSGLTQKDIFQQAIDFWTTVHEKDRDYEFVSETAGVEPWAEGEQT